jgi:sulfite exporter TauE/SafE
MTSLLVAFITGFTTGGLSCMAVQGGLLASSLANQIEKDLEGAAHRTKKGRNPRLAFPILVFLASKLIVYTLMGALLGGVGQIFKLTPTLQAILQFAIAIFMIGNALRMLKVHPFFRYFSFEPPSSVTRFIRRKSKQDNTWFTPLFLGAMTILIPCGVTQTMMAAALATGNPLLGAALMFAFTLGTTPVFFALSYFATRLGALVEKYFVRIVAVTLIVLGILAFDTGLNLLGSRYSLTRMVNDLSGKGQESSQVLQGGSDIEVSSNILTLKAVNEGYRPQTLHAPANTAVTLQVVTRNTRSCSRAFLIPSLDYGVILDATGTEVVEIPPQQPGTVMPFTCSMGMYTGEIIFDL